MDIGMIVVVAALVGLFFGAVVWMEMQSRRHRGNRAGSEKVESDM